MSVNQIPQSTLELEGTDGEGVWRRRTPISFTWTDGVLRVEMEGTLPANDYNVDGTFAGDLSRADAERLRDWLTGRLT